MSELKAKTLFDSLSTIEDPRVKGRSGHLLIDILVIAICATICGVEAWTEIEEFGEAK